MATSLIIFLTIAAVSCSRHQPFNQTWSVTSYLDGKVLYSTTCIAPLDTFFPTLKFNLTDIMEPGPARYPCSQCKVEFYPAPEVIEKELDNVEAPNPPFVPLGDANHKHLG